MTASYFLSLRLISDATFGKGDGVPSVVDVEVQHDKYGLPYLGGKSLKGLLNDACADILFALRRQDQHQRWERAAERLSGRPGSVSAASGKMEVGDARLPGDLRAAVQVGVERGELSREQVLESLTAIRRQTRIDPETGAAQRETLRSMRVILRDTVFESELRFPDAPTDDDLPLLAATTKAFRRAGTGRNRGRGELCARLLDSHRKDVTEDLFELFRRGVEA